MRAALAIVAISAAALAAPARAEDDPACARFEDPLAYNACLARHGPKANNIGAAPAPAAAGRIEPEESVPAATTRRARGVAHVVQRHGRVHVEFQIR